MAQTPTVVVGGNVEGNITSCKLETKQLSFERDSAFSFTGYAHYQTYNVCTGVPVQNYALQEISGFGWFTIIFASILLMAIIAASASSY